ncbi:DUF6879 family protein [Streptomyces sp. XD-27]|uniref:DUF6879 family protein n=1 Tax=Streptomyces sp. XD-27 TaxID=3062779 RepID=UPI0026F468EE|nr:DUF6879 family protein [Streptomyces sp. XD-27]WKX70209.1 hypothetical protein Q3Y56_10020 [Streptomyces sp. XD-27]
MAEVPTFEELFRNCRRSALHLEMRDGYMRSDPSYIAWQKGERDRAADQDPAWRPWLDLMQETISRGVVVRRARIVSEPISDYIRFEHHVTVGNVQAGEQVRWLPRRRATDLALPGNDFWLFDDEVVLVNHFDGDGEWAPEGHTELVTDPAVAKLCSTAFEAVWERAVPHEEYQPR